MSHYDDVEALTRALKLIEEAIPGFEILTKRRMAGLIRYASVPDDCIYNTVVMARDMPAAAEVSGLDLDYALDTIEFSKAYASFVQAVERTLMGARNAILLRRADVGQAVLTAIAIAKRNKQNARQVKRLQKALAKKQRRFPKKPKP